MRYDPSGFGPVEQHASEASSAITAGHSYPDRIQIGKIQVPVKLHFSSRRGYSPSPAVVGGETTWETMNNSRLGYTPLAVVTVRHLPQDLPLLPLFMMSKTVTECQPEKCIVAFICSGFIAVVSFAVQLCHCPTSVRSIKPINTGVFAFHHHRFGGPLRKTACPRGFCRTRSRSRLGGFRRDWLHF